MLIRGRMAYKGRMLIGTYAYKGRMDIRDVWLL